MTLPELLGKWSPVLLAGGWPSDSIDVSERTVDLVRETLRARVAHRALVGLLVSRGIITVAQYDAAIAAVVDAVDDELTERFPRGTSA